MVTTCLKHPGIRVEYGPIYHADKFVTDGCPLCELVLEPRFIYVIGTARGGYCNHREGGVVVRWDDRDAPCPLCSVFGTVVESIYDLPGNCIE